MWNGDFKEFPDHLAQGESAQEFEVNLRDLHRNLISAEMPDVRRPPNSPLDEEDGPDPRVRSGSLTGKGGDAAVPVAH